MAEERSEVPVAGLEDAVSNDLALSNSWQDEDAWSWKGKSHINLLETAATLRMMRSVAKDGGDARVVYMGDPALPEAEHFHMQCGLPVSNQRLFQLHMAYMLQGNLVQQGSCQRMAHPVSLRFLTQSHTQS